MKSTPVRGAVESREDSREARKITVAEGNRKEGTPERDKWRSRGRRTMGFRWMGFSAASFRACWACQVRCLVAGGIGRRRIGATWKVAEGEKVAVGEWRKAARQREGRNGREGEEETARILGSVRSCAVVVVEFGGGGIHNFASCHSVSNRAFSIHSSCTPRGTYERVTRWFARRYGTVEGRARVDSSFSGLLSSGMRHFNPEECTSRRNTDAFLKLAVLSRRVVYIYIYRCRSLLVEPSSVFNDRLAACR